MTSPDVARGASPMIDVHALRKSYRLGDAEVEVLAGVDLEIRSGEVVALRGPSGSGKSTLLNILGCLDRPSSGQYVLGGCEVSELSRAAQAWVRLHFIGFIFQSFNLLAGATAAENVALPLYYAGIRRKERDARAIALLAQVGLGNHLGHFPAQLSGGQCQRVAIARALAGSPRLLLADEPTGALDSRNGAEVLDLMLTLQRQEGLTMILVTHDPAVAELADREVHLLDGCVVEGQAP